VPSWDILGNVIPFTARRGEKIETETNKILGALKGGAVDKIR
jgi:aspartate-semialdehyde dehydrogenase